MAFNVSSPFLPILLISSFTRTEKFMHSLVFSLKQVNCPSNVSTSSFKIK